MPTMTHHAWITFQGRTVEMDFASEAAANAWRTHQTMVIRTMGIEIPDSGVSAL
jgi:hypothetical protein